MRFEHSPKVTPCSASNREDVLCFDWGSLVPYVIHPVKVAIIEALMWIDRPLSSSQMEHLFDRNSYYLGVVAHHAKGLKDWGALEVVRTRPVRGAKEKFYFFPGRY
jgi:hypothetical protein